MMSEDEAVTLARRAKLSTAEWPDVEIAVFAAEGSVIAYVPTKPFRIAAVVRVEEGVISYLPACLDDCTRAAPDDHVLRVGDDMPPQKFVRKGDTIKDDDGKVYTFTGRCYIKRDGETGVVSAVNVLQKG